VEEAAHDASQVSRQSDVWGGAGGGAPHRGPTVTQEATFKWFTCPPLN